MQKPELRNQAAKWLLASILLSAGTKELAAQQAPPPGGTASEQSSQSSADRVIPSGAPIGPAKSSQTPGKGTSKDRLFFALPNFLTLENAKNVPPLTPKQKFKVVTKSSFDVIEVVWYGALAGFSQAENNESGYGQGAAGYWKRYGSHFADGTIENYLARAALPSILHQDPRYFQLGQGSFLHRLRYAASRILITRTDSGRSQFNYSEVLGSAAAANISTFTYHPPEDRNFMNGLSVWGTQMGYDALSLVLKEFWPDVRRKIQPSSANKPTH